MTERKKMSPEEVASSEILKKLKEVHESVADACQIGKHKLGDGEPLPWDHFDSEGLINRQVALAVYSNLIDFWGGKRDKIEDYTGKKASHWNFQLLGTQRDLMDQPEYHMMRTRVEQRTTNYFVVSLLHALKQHGISFDWDQFEEVMASYRFRVISKPWNSDMGATVAWEESGVRDLIGVDYPAPWDIAMKFGRDHEVSIQSMSQNELTGEAEMQVEPATNFMPCRIENLGVKSYLLSEHDIQGDPKISRWCLKGIGEPKSVEGPQAGGIALKQAEAQIIKLSMDLAKAMEKINEQEMMLQQLVGDADDLQKQYRIMAEKRRKPFEVRLSIDPMTGKIKQL